MVDVPDGRRRGRALRRAAATTSATRSSSRTARCSSTTTRSARITAPPRRVDLDAGRARARPRGSTAPDKGGTLTLVVDGDDRASVEIPKLVRMLGSTGARHRPRRVVTGRRRLRPAVRVHRAPSSASPSTSAAAPTPPRSPRPPGPSSPRSDMTELILDSLRRRMRAMHSLWEDADRHDGPRPGEPRRTRAGAADRVLDLPLGADRGRLRDDARGRADGLRRSWATRMGLADRGPRQAQDRRRDGRPAHRRLRRVQGLHAAGVHKTESWLADARTVDAHRRRRGPPVPAADRVHLQRPGRRRGGITRLDATECWIYQHGLRHMGEIEHARASSGSRA